jgi:hypothetical protein
MVGAGLVPALGVIPNPYVLAADPQFLREFKVPPR